MTTDTISKQILENSDTLKNKAFHLASEINSKIDSDFDFKRTLIAALIGAMIGQGLIIFISWIKSKIDLRTKKRLLVTDLNNQKIIIKRLEKEYEILLEKFENKNLMTHTYDAFEDLHTDIYNSITKTDLFKIFGSRITIIVKVYKTIGFLEKNSVDCIYNNYLTKTENHTREKRDTPNHERFCPTHLGYIDNAIIQLRENIKTSQETIGEIEGFVK